MSVAEMRERRIKREEKEARAQGRQRVPTPAAPAPQSEKPVHEPSFRARFLLADAKGRFGGVVKAISHKLPTGLLAQEEPEVEVPPLHLPRIPHAAGALANHGELMDQLSSEARGALEVLEQSELFTGIQAAQAPQGHTFTAEWCEDALRASGFDPAPPPKTTSSTARGQLSSAGKAGATALPESRGQTSTGQAALSRPCQGHSARGRQALAVTHQDGHAPAHASGSDRQQASHRQHGDRGLSATSSRNRGGIRSSGKRGGAAAVEQGQEPGAARATLSWDKSEVAPVMRHLEERTKLEIAALDSEFSRLMSYGDGALTARARLESIRYGMLQGAYVCI